MNTIIGVIRGLKSNYYVKFKRDHPGWIWIFTATGLGYTDIRRIWDKLHGLH